MTASCESSLSCINADCCICLDTLNNHIITDIEVTQCGHMFHGTCFASWLQRGRNSCPLCRTRISHDRIASRRVANSFGWQIRTNELPPLPRNAEYYPSGLRIGEMERDRLPDLVPAIGPRSTHYLSDDGTYVNLIILPTTRSIRTIDFQTRFSDSAEDDD
jgi:hypothetical protein